MKTWLESSVAKLIVVKDTNLHGIHIWIRRRVYVVTWRFEIRLCPSGKGTCHLPLFDLGTRI